MINPLGADLVNPSPSIAALAYQRGKARKDEGTGVQDNIANSMVTMMRALGDPKEGVQRLLNTQARRMEMTMQGLQGKGAMGYFPRTVALVLISLVAGAR
jgi:hypothetical protein